MLQLGHRFYWPDLGRFIQQDPIGSGVNWYAYARNNPLVWIDPEGLWCAEDHREWSLAAAQQAGASLTFARVIATAAEEVDYDYATIGGLPHFPSERPWVDYVNRETAEAEALWAEGARGKALQALGRALHALQDSTVHPENSLAHFARGFSEDPAERPTEAHRARTRSRAWLKRFFRRVSQ